MDHGSSDPVSQLQPLCAGDISLACAASILATAGPLLARLHFNYVIDHSFSLLTPGWANRACLASTQSSSGQPDVSRWSQLTHQRSLPLCQTKVSTLTLAPITESTVSRRTTAQLRMLVDQLLHVCLLRWRWLPTTCLLSFRDHIAVPVDETVVKYPTLAPDIHGVGNSSGYNFPNSSGFTYQAEAVHRCLAAGLLECPQYTQEESLCVTKILDGAQNINAATAAEHECEWHCCGSCRLGAAELVRRLIVACVRTITQVSKRRSRRRHHRSRHQIQCLTASCLPCRVLP